MDSFDFSDSIEIAASPDVVFAHVSDLALMGSWSPENTGGQWLEGATGPSLGARFEGTNKNGEDTWSTTAIVTRFEPAAAFGFHVTWQEFDISDWLFTMTATEVGCELRESWSDCRPPSFLAEDAEAGFDRAAFTKTSIRTTLERLKATCEA
jgi:hypothetical protein